MNSNMDCALVIVVIVVARYRRNWMQ